MISLTRTNPLQLPLKFLHVIAKVRVFAHLMTRVVFNQFHHSQAIQSRQKILLQSTNSQEIQCLLAPISRLSHKKYKNIINLIFFPLNPLLVIMYCLDCPFKDDISRKMESSITNDSFF